MQNIQIVVAEVVDEINIGSPYSAPNNEEFRVCGGTFERVNDRWHFPRSEATKAMIERLFGDDSGPLVTVEITQKDITEIDNAWQLGGYLVANRRYFDKPVTTYTGVQLAKGAFLRSGGTASAPRVTGTVDLVIHVVVRASFAKREGLKVIETHDHPLDNPLEIFTDEDLIKEIRRRGISGF